MKPQFHISGVEMLLRCGEAFRRRYIEGEKIPPAIALHVGSSIHAVIRGNLRRKKDTGILMSDEEIRDVARTDLERRWSNEGVLLQAEEKILGEKAVKGEAIDKSVRLSMLHHARLAPKLFPTAIERPFTLDVEGYDFQLVGQIDQQYGLAAIRDVKSRSKGPNKDAAEHSRQLTMYAMGIWAEEGQTPELVMLDNLIDNKTPDIKTQISRRSIGDFNALLNVIQVTWEGIQKGVFYPAPQGVPGVWWCHPTFCGYYRTCKYVRNSKSASVNQDLVPPLKESLIQIGKTGNKPQAIL